LGGGTFYDIFDGLQYHPATRGRDFGTAPGASGVPVSARKPGLVALSQQKSFCAGWSIIYRLVGVLMHSQFRIAKKRSFPARNIEALKSEPERFAVEQEMNHFSVL
jgi:hypothetical protein